MSDRADRRKRSNIRQYSAEDQALNQISKEADLRLQAKRAARAEAREIRLKEIEKQQKEAEERQDRLHGLTSDHVKTRQLSGSRRNSTDSTESMESRDRDRDLRAENRELEEKYKQAMMTSATLDNEKQTLVYQLELLKDQIEEMEEGHIELQREHKDRCRELEMKKRAYTELEAEVKILKEHMVLKDKLIEESGFVIMSTEDGSYKLEKNTSLSNGPVPSGGSVLLSTDSIALLKEAGDGSLGTASQHHSRSSPMHETNPSRNGNVDIAESESQGSQGSNLVQGVEFLAKDKGSEVSAEEQAKSVSDVNKDTEGNLNDPVGKEGGESEDIPSDSGSVLTHEKELVETSSSEADSNKDQPAIVTDVVDRAECADVGKNKEMGSDVSSGIIETNVTDQSEVNVSKDPVDFNSGTDKDGTVCSVNDIVEVAEKVCKDEADSKMCAPVLELDLVKDSPDGIPRDDSGIFSPDDVAVPHAGFSSGKFDVKIIEPEPDTDEEGDEFFDAVSTPSPFLNKTGSQYDFKEGEDHQKFAENEGKISSDSENNETEKSLGSTTTNRDVQRKDSNSKTNNEEFVQTVPEDSGKLDIEEDTEEDGVDSTKKVVTEGQKVEEQQSDEQRDVNGETHITKTTFDNNEDQVDLVVKSEDTAQTQPVALFSETKSDDKMKSNENVMEDSDFPTAVDSVDGSECSEIVTGESVDTSTKVSTTLHSAELDLINGTHCKKEDKLAKTGSEDTESDVDEDDDQFKDAEEIDQEKDTFETVSPQDVHSDNDEKDAEVRQKNKAEKKDEMKSLNSEEMYGSSVDPVENEPEAANKVVPCTEDSEVNVCGQLSGDTTQESETSQAEQETKHIESEDNSGFHFVSIDGIVTGESETDNHEEELSNVSRELEVQNAGPVDTEQIQEMQDTDVDITLSKGAEGGEDDTEERSETGLFSEKISAELQQTQESVEEQNEPTGLERGDEVEGGDIDTSTENPEDSKADIIHTNDVQDRAHESSSDTFTDEKKSCQKKASGVNSEDMNADDMSSETKPEETKHTDSKEPLEEMKQTENGESPCIEEMKPAESKEEPFTEDVKQTDCGEGPCTEDVKQTESGEGPSTEDVKQTESGEGPSTEDVKQTESGEGPCEDVKQTESGENPCTEDVKQTESGEGPCEDVKQTESGENPCTEDVKQTENREGPCEDVKQTESGEGPSTEDVKQTESGEDPCTEDVKQTENREGPWAEEPKSEKTKDQEQELVPGVTESGANDKDSKCEKSEVDIIDKDNDEETSDKDADGTEEGDNEHKEDGVTKERRESQNDLKEDTLDEDKTKSVEGDQLEDKVSRKEGNNQAVDEKKKEDISARGEINKEKTFKRSECSVDSDDDVFVKDSVSPHKDDVPESAVSPSKKKSGSQMKSEGELSEDDLLDDAYSFDDIDEVLEEDDDQKVDGEKKDQSPKKQSQVVDPPMIVIDKASTDTEHEEKDENQSIASSTKASSSDSVSTGSGKDATELVSDDAGYGGSGAEGTAVHPPPSPKEGKKGKKFGKFFKNIFK